MNSQDIIIKVRRLAATVHGQYRLSQRGVPYIILKVGNIWYSICYFATNDIWRIFYPWGDYAVSQTKLTIKTEREVEALFNTLLSATSKQCSDSIIIKKDGDIHATEN